MLDDVLLVIGVNLRTHFCLEYDIIYPACILTSYAEPDVFFSQTSFDPEQDKKGLESEWICKKMKVEGGSKCRNKDDEYQQVLSKQINQGMKKKHRTKDLI